MPKEPIKYENTIIYKIICLIPDINNIYVGITTDIIRRKYYHKVKSMDPKNNKYKLYHFINQHGGFNNFDIIEIRKYPCMNNNEAKAQQYKYIKLLNADLNSNNVITKTNNVKTFFSDENNHRVINITKARKVKQNNDIKRQEKQQQLINNNKQTELYNEQLQKIKEEKKEIKRQIFLQQELNELNNLKKHLNKNKPVIQPMNQQMNQPMSQPMNQQLDRFNSTTCFFQN